MTRIDPNKKIQKAHTEQEMRLALVALINGKHTLHIPPQVEDADMVFFDIIEELLEARKKLAILEPLQEQEAKKSSPSTLVKHFPQIPPIYRKQEEQEG
jgi:hypothetical protein